MNRWLEHLITFIYPAKCRRCETPMGVGRVHYLCDACWEAIEFLTTPWCQICGTPIAFHAESPPHANVSCRDCQNQPPSYGKFRSIAFYEPTVREAIHLLKYEKKQILARHLTQLLHAHFPADLVGTDYDFLLPIPLHFNRHSQRGFNQAERIAQGIAQRWNAPICTDLLVRIKDTVPQSSLSSHEERLQNIAGAFEVRVPDVLHERKILLIDDIFTTGTTINEALKVLQTAHPTCVDVFTLARTRPRPGQTDGN